MQNLRVNVVLLKDIFKINKRKWLLSIPMSECFSTEILSTFDLYQLSEKFVPTIVLKKKIYNWQKNKTL